MPDEQYNPLARPLVLLWKRILGWTIVVLLYAAIAGMAVGSFFLLRHTFGRGTELDDRFFDALYAAVLLFLPVTLVSILIKTRRSTGRWTRPRGQCAVRCTALKSSPPNWIIFSTNWATFTAGDPAASTPKRALAWTVIVLFAAALLAVTAIALICFGAAFADDNTHLATFLFLAFGVAILLVPVLTVRSYIKKKRLTGSWRTSPEQMHIMRNAKARWHEREYARPLRTKVLSIAITAVILLFCWLRYTVFHAHHPTGNWVTPAIWTVFATYGVWVQFRKPSGSSSQGSQQ